MKKFIFSALAAIGLWLTPSCSDDNEALSGSGNEALVSFNVNLADGINTKADQKIGDGTRATKLFVDVYEISGDTYRKINNLIEPTDFDENKQAKVEMTLVKGKEYGFVFLAKNPNSIYSMDDQTIIADYTQPECNKEEYDVFLATDKFVPKQSFDRSVTLYRPLAQLNYLVSQSDLDAAATQEMNLTDLQTSIKISDAARTLHPFTNTVSDGELAVTFTPTRLQDLSSGNTSKQGLELPKIDGSVDENGNPKKETYYYLATTYFLVNANGEMAEPRKAQDLVTATMTIEGLTAEDYALKVDNVPVQCNYRTNIYGNLLTASGQFVVSIEAAFEGANNLPNVETVSSVGDIQTALANGSNTIKAAADFDIPADGVIPVPKNENDENEKEISFDFSAVDNTSTLTFQETNGTGEATAKNISIIANGNVVIDLPQSTVTLNGSHYEQVTATTAPNSLYIERGVTVNKLTAIKGNVHIKGTIGEFTKGTNYRDQIFYYISTAEQLKELAGVVNGTVTEGLLQSIYSENPIILLDEDIDLRGVEWMPIGGNTMGSYPSTTFSGTFDGQNHTISNLTTSSNQPDYATAGLFGSVTNATIKNVKLSNVNVSSTHYAGAIVGYHSEGTLTVKNCSVDGGTLTSTPEYGSAEKPNDWNNGDKVGGIVGYTTNGAVSNCTVSNVTIKAYRGLGGISGQFTGSATNNTITNLTLIIDATHDYKGNSYEANARPIIGNAAVEGNTATNVVYQVASETALTQAMKYAQDATVQLAAGTYSNIINVQGKRLTIEPIQDANIVIAGVDGQQNGEHTGTIICNNITFDNSKQTEGWYTGTSNPIYPCVGVWGGDFTFNNCTFLVDGNTNKETGIMTWWTTEETNMRFKGCMFNGIQDHEEARAMQIYGHVNLTVENCTFTTKKRYALKYAGKDGNTAILKNNTVSNCEYMVELGSSPYPGNNYTVTFDNNLKSATTRLI